MGALEEDLITFVMLMKHRRMGKWIEKANGFMENLPTHYFL